jgi:hydroxyethylthiazole kinase
MPDLHLTESFRHMAAHRPLIHHITNWVTIYPCAQVTRSWGCLPVMAHASEEAADMAGLASALVLNIGTLTPDLVDAMEKAASAARRKGIPVVLDAVGAGATKLRTVECRNLVDTGTVSVIKGNAGEIATLAGVKAEVRGVESISSEGSVSDSARLLAQAAKAVVVVTGKIDYVTDGSRVWALEYGHPLMGRVVGTGCASSSTAGCFAALGGDLMEKCAQAMAAYGRAGEMTAEEAHDAGRFWEVFYGKIERLVERSEGLVLHARDLQ